MNERTEQRIRSVAANLADLDKRVRDLSIINLDVLSPDERHHTAGDLAVARRKQDEVRAEYSRLVYRNEEL